MLYYLGLSLAYFGRIRRWGVRGWNPLSEKRDEAERAKFPVPNMAERLVP